MRCIHGDKKEPEPFGQTEAVREEEALGPWCLMPGLVPWLGEGIHQGRGQVNARKIGSVYSQRQAQGPNGLQSGHRLLWGHTGHLGLGRCHFVVFLSA